VNFAYRGYDLGCVYIVALGVVSTHRPGVEMHRRAAVDLLAAPWTSLKTRAPPWSFAETDTDTETSKTAMYAYTAETEPSNRTRASKFCCGCLYIPVVCRSLLARGGQS
jgi:hypothetical protein